MDNASVSGDHSSKESSTSRLGMGSYNEQQGGNITNSFHGVGRCYGGAGNEESSESSFYTRTGAEDSKYRQYFLDVDPTQGDRAADIALLSFGRPHMRGFHLAWMSFFVAL